MGIWQLLLLVAIGAGLFFVVKAAGALRHRRGRRTMPTRAQRPRPSFGFWFELVFTYGISLIMIGAVGAAVGGLAGGGGGAAAGVLIVLLLFGRRRVFRFFARLRKRRCLATFLEKLTEGPFNGPVQGKNCALFDCNGERLKFLLTPRQAWDISYERSGSIGHLTFAGRHLFRWEPVSPLAPDRDSVGVLAFISYAHEQAAEARYLEQVLQSRGLDVWLDEDRLHVGSALNTALPEEIIRSRFFVPLLSSDYLASGWCIREFEFAVTNRIDIRPVKLTDEDLTFPPRFRELFENELGTPVYLDVRHGDLPERVDQLAQQMADDGFSHPEISEELAQVDSVQAAHAPGSELTPPPHAGLVSDKAAAEPGDFDAEKWLATIGLERYAENFRDNDIDSITLIHSLTDADLQSIGVSSLGHRKRFLSAMHSMQESPSNSTTDTPPPESKPPSPSDNQPTGKTRPTKINKTSKKKRPRKSLAVVTGFDGCLYSR